MYGGETTNSPAKANFGGNFVMSRLPYIRPKSGKLPLPDNFRLQPWMIRQAPAGMSWMYYVPVLADSGPDSDTTIVLYKGYHDRGYLVKDTR